MISLVAKNNDNGPSTLVKTLEKCDKDFFPNIYTLLQLHLLCLLLPVDVKGQIVPL